MRSSPRTVQTVQAVLKAVDALRGTVLDLAASLGPPTGTNGHARNGARRSRFATLWNLTPTQATVLEHLVRGESNKEVAAALHRKPKTVETHATRVFRKAGVANRAQLAAKFWARSNGIRVFPDRD